MSESFHIIAFDVPYPPNYGGIVDVYYKLKHLHAQGGKIIYHCFYYKGHNPKTTELDQFCDQIYYYERKPQLSKIIFNSLPYIVSSRNNAELLANLCKDNYPILFDGLQCCYFLNHNKLNGRKKLVRANNIEHLYYDGLAKSEKNFFKQLYLKNESKKLKKFEHQLKGVDGILSVAKMDISHFNKYAKTYHVPPFFNSTKKQFKHNANSEKFCLFQGNLSVTENKEAANFILDNIANKCKYPIKIAGKNPSNDIINKIKSIKNVELISSPPQHIMDKLIENAHINLLFTFQQTGIKLKLLHALESGKHVLINEFMDDSNIFKSMCTVANEPESIINEINNLMAVEFTPTLYDKRYKLFSKYYNNTTNANTILKLINL